MTDRVHPSFNRDAESFKTATAISYAGGSDGWIKDGSSPTQAAQDDSNLNNADFNTFAETSGGSSLDVDIDAGEGFVFGAWVARDSTTQVTLAASTNGQTVYLGYDRDVDDTAIIGLDSAFDAVEAKIPLYDFDTDGSGVTSVTDRRSIGRTKTLGDDESYEFGAAPDFSIGYDSSNDWFELIDEVNSVDVLRGHKNGLVEVPNGNLKVAGGDIDEVGGTTSASTGAIRLADSTEILARDTTDSLDHGLALDSNNLSDSGKAQLTGDATPQGYAMIQDTTNNVSCLVFLGGSANTVEILHDSGSGNNFTTTEDNDGTTNIYWDSGNGQYELNNETGGSATYAVEVMKA